jgi:hypothetical protein
MSVEGGQNLVLNYRSEGPPKTIQHGALGRIKPFSTFYNQQEPLRGDAVYTGTASLSTKAVKLFSFPFKNAATVPASKCLIEKRLGTLMPQLGRLIEKRLGTLVLAHQGKRNHIPDGAAVREQHDEAVDPDPKPTSGRHPILKCHQKVLRPNQHAGQRQEKPASHNILPRHRHPPLRGRLLYTRTDTFTARALECASTRIPPRRHLRPRGRQQPSLQPGAQTSASGQSGR